MSPQFESVSLLVADERLELLRCRHKRSGKPMLVKHARGTAPAAADLATLKREAELIAALPSAKSLEARWLAEASSLVMQDPGGEPLSALLAAERPKLELALAVANQVASTLAELHGLGLVHNALRPDVILCDAAEQRAWLVDFGQADRPAHSSPRAISGGWRPGLHGA
jgi:serine/threonine protein kinase